MNKKINLAWMYPDILNLHGERGNVQAFKHVSEMLKVKLDIERIDDIEAQIDFDKYDILLFNCGELKVVPTLIKFLKPQLNKLNEYINSNKYIIATGATSAFLGNKITLMDGNSYDGLKIMNVDFKERNKVIGDDIYFTLNEKLKLCKQKTDKKSENYKKEIVGSQIQMVDVNINDETPLGKIKYGFGNIGKSDEGVIKNNVIFTNCLGPFIVKNPWFAEMCIRDICNNKKINISKNAKTNYEIEINSLKAIKEFIENKKKI